MADDRIDAGLLWDGDYGRTVPLKDGICNAAVHDGYGVGFHRCGRKGKIRRDVVWHGKPMTLGYCGIHDPVAVKAKREAREAKWRVEREAADAARAESNRLRQLREAAVDAIKAIAKGHNDPRSLAIHVLTSCKEPIE